MYRRRSPSSPVVVIAACIAMPVAADVSFYDITGDPDRWHQATSGVDLAPGGHMDLGDLPDFGKPHPAEPPLGTLCHEGNSEIPPGFVPSGVCFYANDNDRICHTGPTGGFDPPSNAIVPSFFVDSFDIIFNDPVVAVEIWALSFLGSDTVDLIAFDEHGLEIGRMEGGRAVPTDGNRWGALATGDDRIALLRVYDAGGGAEGIMDITFWTDPSSTSITSAEIVTGAHVAGNVDDLRASDNTRFEARSGFGRDLAELHVLDLHIFAATHVQNPRMMSIAVESSIDEPAGTLKVAARNWRTNQMDSVGHGPVGQGEDTIIFDGIDAAEYVRLSGGIELGVKHIVFAQFLAFRFDAMIDRVSVEVE